MKTIKFTKIALLAFLTFGLFACSDDDDGGDVITPSNTIADFVAGNPDYSSLGAALEVATIGSGVITGRTELGERAATGDFFLVYDTSAGSLKKIQTSNIVKASVTRNATGDGSATAFTVTSGVTVDSVLVYENGVCQKPTTDYTVSGTTLTFQGGAPASGVAIQIRELPA